MSVYEDLSKLGTPQGAAFNQGSFRRTHDAVEGADLTGGYCAGVALDWCRRVLLSRADRDPSFLSYSKAGYGDPGPSGMSRQETTTRRMAKAYAEQGDPYVSETNLQKVKALLPQLLNLPEQNAIGKFKKGVRLTREQATLITKIWNLNDDEIDLGKVVPGQLTKARIQQFIGVAQTRTDYQHRARDSEGRGWDNMAQLMDERFNQIRVSEGRQVSDKPFSGIRVRRSKTQESYGAPSQWAHELRTEGYEVACCTLVSLSPGSGSGHAVVVYQRGADSYDFFDPNYGVFRMNLQNLALCFQHLFWTPYFKSKPGTLDGNLAVYRRRDGPDSSPDSPWIKMSYTVFERVPV